jgi:hypothetical protein
MKKSGIIFGICISAMFLIPAIGNATLTTSEEPQSNTSRPFATCYIEASGDISERDWFAIIRLPNMWKTFWFRPPANDFEAFVSLWRIIYDPESIVTIYAKQDGRILWEQNGRQDVQLVIIGFHGTYIPESTNPDGRLHVEISGNALFIIPKFIRR